MKKVVWPTLGEVIKYSLAVIVFVLIYVYSLGIILGFDYKGVVIIMEKEWYVVNTYSGHESKVKEKLEQRAESNGNAR